MAALPEFLPSCFLCAFVSWWLDFFLPLRRVFDRRLLAADGGGGVASLAVALLLAASLAVLALLAVRRGLRPLLLASAEIESRSLQRLQPIALTSVPREAEPFVRALNDLFARLQVAASAQRAFIEDAAHQLRTPLSTLRVETARALSQAHPPELRPTLERLQAAAERGARLAQQLLTLARAEGAALGADASKPTVDLATLAAAAADDWLHPALAAGQDLGFELQPAPVAGDELLLGELLGNLVHNAIQHAGPGAHITVRTRSAGGQAILEVEDNGQGMPAAELEAAWQRFHRGSSATGPGTGLGLAIVRDIARLHGGDARLLPGAGGRGIVAHVSLPVEEAVAKLS